MVGSFPSFLSPFFLPFFLLVLFHTNPFLRQIENAKRSSLSSSFSFSPITKFISQFQVKKEQKQKGRKQEQGNWVDTYGEKSTRRTCASWYDPRFFRSVKIFLQRHSQTERNTGLSYFFLFFAGKCEMKALLEKGKKGEGKRTLESQLCTKCHSRHNQVKNRFLFLLYFSQMHF